MVTFLRVLVFGLGVCFVHNEAMATTITIDPLKTFLFTNNDPWSGSGSVAGSVPIVLSDIGISGGDTIHLEMLGDWYDGHAGYSVNVVSLDVVSEMIGVSVTAAHCLRQIFSTVSPVLWMLGCL